MLIYNNINFQKSEQFKILFNSVGLFHPDPELANILNRLLIFIDLARNREISIFEAM